MAAGLEVSTTDPDQQYLVCEVFSNWARPEELNFSKSRRLNASSRTVAGETEPFARPCTPATPTRRRPDRPGVIAVAAVKRHQVLVLADAPHRLRCPRRRLTTPEATIRMQGPPDRRAIRQGSAAPATAQLRAARSWPTRTVANTSLMDNERSAPAGPDLTTAVGVNCGAVDPAPDIQRDPFDLASRCRLVGAHLLQAL